jgi:hypothetical protein
MKTQMRFGDYLAIEENIWDCHWKESMDIALINFTGEVSERALNVTFIVAFSVGTLVC